MISCHNGNNSLMLKNKTIIIMVQHYTVYNLNLVNHFFIGYKKASTNTVNSGCFASMSCILQHKMYHGFLGESGKKSTVTLARHSSFLAMNASLNG